MNGWDKILSNLKFTTWGKIGLTVVNAPPLKLCPSCGARMNLKKKEKATP